MQSQTRFIVVDDNMYYKSMIKPYKRLAAHYEYRFIHLILDVSVEDAIARNSARER